MNAQDLTVWRKWIEQWIVGTGSHLGQFALQPVPCCLFVMDGVFAPQRGLMQQFVKVLHLHSRGSVKVVGQDLE